MTKKLSTKKALIMSALSLLLCCSMLVGTTFAWFTDTVSSDRNVIVAGNLDIELEYWNGQSYAKVTNETELFNSEALWEPGYTEIAYLKVSNAGSLALKYQLNVNVLNEVTGLTKNNEEIKLSDHLVFKVVYADTDLADTYTRETAMQAAGNDMGLASYNSDSKSLAAKNETGDNDYYDYVAIIIYMPTNVGNEANHDGEHIPTIDMGVTLLATQDTVESDGFGNEYDKNATYPNSKTDTVEGGESIAYSNVTVTLPDGMAEGNFTLVVDNKSTQVSANGETVISFDINLLKDNTKVEKQDGVNYTVSVDVGAGLLLTGVLHNGQPINEYDYDLDTGIVTFDTDSFSPFAVIVDTTAIPANNVDSLNSALAKGETVGLVNDITEFSSGAIKMLNGGILDGNGKTVKCTSGKTNLTGITTTGGTIKNIVVHTATKTIQGIGAGMVYDNSLTQDLYLENVTVYAAYYAVVGTANNVQVVVKDSTLYGGISYMGASLIDVTDTHFAIDLFTAPQMTVIELSGAAKFTDCSFDSGYCINAEYEAKGSKIEFVNCEVNGVKLTAENFADLLIDDIYDGYGSASSKNMKNCVITVDGVAVAW